LILLQLVLALSLTGYLLPWDQKGYWATKVATNLVAVVPWVGADLQRLIVGGPEYGHHTLTRFFALHAGVLPGATLALVMIHVYLFRRHGLKVKEPKLRADTTFWPDQVLKDAVACLAVMAAVLFLILRPRLFGSHQLGPDLGAPADGTEPYSAARPEWYFLFLFQFLKFFPGGTEVWGAIVIPGVVMGMFFLMPLIGRWRIGNLQVGHWIVVGTLCSLIAGAALLTYLALGEDRRNEKYQAAVKVADQDAERVRVLAKSPAGIPSEGAVTLLRHDPLTQGPRLFAQKCAGCHRYGGTDAMGLVSKDPQSAADLKGFASREWLTGMLDPDRVSSTNYFGGTKFHDGKMVKFVKKDIAGYSDEQKAQLKKVIMALSAEAQLRSQLAADQRDAGAIAEGRTLLTETMRCTDCHQFHKKDEDATGPDLTNYGSRKWLISTLNNPAHPDLYGKRNDRMPAFGAEQILSEQQIGLIADWLRGTWYEPAP
jgi:ubiquinol-cytochrome c reductase cytochrome b subunit